MQGLAAVNPRQAAQYLRNAGRDGDTDVVHVNEREKMMLEAMGGRGTINPATGLREYATLDNFDRDFYMSQNPDVAASGMDPFVHYQQFGQSEGRTGNQLEQQVRDEEGYTGTFGGGAYGDWRLQQLQQNGLVDESGNIRSDLTGGKVDVNEAGSLDDLLARNTARAQGYAGDWGQGGYGAFGQVYYDHDNDPSTPMVAPNAANIDKYGKDASGMRDQLRMAGYSGNWGAGGAGNFVQSELSKYGLQSTGDAQRDIDAILAAMNAPVDFSGTQSGSPTLEYGDHPAYEHRNYRNAAQLATPTNLARYYDEQGINTMGGDHVYGTMGGEHLFFPSRVYQIDPTGGTGGTE